MKIAGAQTNLKQITLIALMATLGACGGGRGDLRMASNGIVSVVITDDLTLAYSEVWVDVQSISATDANGHRVMLYQDAAGQAHNLRLPNNIASGEQLTTT